MILEQHESPAGRDPFGSINTPLGLARSLREDFPEVETAASVLWWNAVLKIDEQSSNELLYYADNSFFDIFTFPAIAGDPKLALEDGSQLILTESGAERLFGGTDILGAPLQLQIGEEFQPVTVGAVIEDPPNTSTLSFELLISAERLHDFMPMRAFDAWQWVHPYTFALLAKGVSADDLNAVISDRLAEKHNFAERYGKGVLSYHAQPWPEFHLHANYSDGLLVPSRPEYIWGIGIVGFLILVVAAVNYTTISVAASSKRISEVGIRLVLGRDGLRSE